MTLCLLINVSLIRVHVKITTQVHIYVGSNTLWSVQPAEHAPVLGPTGKSTRVALGGVSLTLHGDAKSTQWSFSAEQHIGSGVIATRHSAEGVGVFTTMTVVHPREDVAVVNCR